MDIHMELCIELQKISEQLSAAHRRKIQEILKRHNLIREEK